MKETEVTILDINPAEIQAALKKLGASKKLETRLIVDWYGPKGLTHAGDDPWYLRVRSRSDGSSEVTWKAKSKTTGVSRTHDEINIEVTEKEKMGQLLEAIGLEHYGHQEKDRISYSYQNWKFDIDQYPGMPAYLEIEGESEADIQAAITLLGLGGHRTSNVGERILITETYGLNWFEMKFT